MTWNDERFLTFDFETSGLFPEYALQPWRVPMGTAWATSLVWQAHQGGKTNVYGGLRPTVDDMRDMLECAISEGRVIIGWNVQFDIQWLLAYGLHDLVFQCQWLDGMLLWRHFAIEPEYELTRAKKKSYGLKACVAEYMPDEAGYEEAIDFHSTDPADLAKLHAYNIKDVAFTYELTKMWFRRLTPAQRRAALIESECLPHVALANFKGLPVDVLACAELGARLENVARQKLAELAPHGVTERVVRSPRQLGALMFGEWGLTPIKKTASGADGTDKETLHELSFVDPRVKAVRAYREALNNKAKFADAPLASAYYNGDGCAHPQAIVFGTYSGRLTYSSNQRGREINPKTGKERYVDLQTGFALHQEKRDAEFRNIIAAPPGYTLVEFDAASQEFRWMAIASGDTTMLRLCQPGEDAHAYMGAQIDKSDYHALIEANKAKDKAAKAKRQLGKVANLCLAAGTTVLTDRGPCSIERVRPDDLVWDGEAFVAHDGVVCSGYRPVMTHDGVTATPEHKVLVDGQWVEIREAARLGWRIEPALGTGWTRWRWSAVRIVDGLVRRALSEIGGALCVSALRLWSGAGCELALHGAGAVDTVQKLRDAAETCAEPSHALRDGGGSAAAEARKRVVPAVPEPEGSVVSKLRRAWDRVQVRLRARCGGVGEGSPTTSDISGSGHRPDRKRWSLRAWKSALGYARAEPRKPSEAWVYDIVSCGPRHRFAANGRIVHNSLQYRTNAKRLRSVARVQYGMGMEMPEAEHIHATYHKAYPAVQDYWRRQIELTRNKGYVETYAGRRVQVQGDWSDNREAWALGSTAINYRIQGTGADQKYLALAELGPILPEYAAEFRWDLHDGLYFFVRDEFAKQFAIDAKKLLDDLDYAGMWGFEPPVPLTWDCKMGGSWGTLQEVDFETLL